MTRSQKIAFTITVFCLLLLSTSMASAQQFQVIHTFMGHGDGGEPETGLTPYHGKFLGTSYSNVFSLQSQNGSWVLTPIFNFPLGPFTDGIWPFGKIVVGPDGALYGTTYEGGIPETCPDNNGCGVVYRLQPPTSFCRSVQCFWTETVLHTFTGGADGGNPVSEVVFDRAGNLYGTTPIGGSSNCPSGCGVVYKMTPSAGGWTQTVIYNFTGGSDGQYPRGGLIFDQAGNLYGAAGSAESSGIIYKLTPSNGSWTETVLHSFQDATDGAAPEYSLTTDASGNFYGVTVAGGPQGGGTVYEYSPSGGGSFTVLHAFGLSYGEPDAPSGTPIFDNAGNLYGTTAHGGYLFNDYGSVYKLSPSGNGWTETDLYVFTEGVDGLFPFGSLAFDAQGNLYGTASMGGVGNGTIWRITP